MPKYSHDHMVINYFECFFKAFIYLKFSLISFMFFCKKREAFLHKCDFPEVDDKY